MLVVRRRPNHQRYTGSGFFDSIGHSILKNGVGKVIGSGLESKAAHKLVDSVIDGTSAAIKESVNKGITLAGKKAATAITNNLKRKSPESGPASIKKVDIDKLVDTGSGIILD